MQLQLFGLIAFKGVGEGGRGSVVLAVTQRQQAWGYGQFRMPFAEEIRVTGCFIECHTCHVYVHACDMLQPEVYGSNMFCRTKFKRFKLFDGQYFRIFQVW